MKQNHFYFDISITYALRKENVKNFLYIVKIDIITYI